MGERFIMVEVGLDVHVTRLSRRGRFENGQGEGGTYTSIDPHKLIGFTWDMRRYKPGSTIEVRAAKGDETPCQLARLNLQSESDVDDARLGWAWAMDSLQSFLEAGKALSWEEREARNRA